MKPYLAPGPAGLCIYLSEKQLHLALPGILIPDGYKRIFDMQVKYKTFRGTFATWTDLFTQACEFANTIGRENLISISHSEDKDDGVVTVWYWSE